jgi:hypothetical protein
MAPDQIGVDAVLPVHSGRHMLSDRRARNGLTKARQPRKELVVSYQNERKTRSPVPAVSVSTVRFVKFTGAHARCTFAGMG